MEHIKLSDLVLPEEATDGLSEAALVDMEQEIEKLRASIQEKGLIHNIQVEPFGEDKFRVLAGRKRVLAVQRLGLESVPCDIRTGLTPMEAEELSLHENLKRVHLEWWQYTASVKAFHDMRQRQNDGREDKEKVGRPKRGEKSTWTVRDTAIELGRSLGSVAEDIELARQVDRNPALRNVKDKTTAIKLIRSEKRRIEAEMEAGAPTLPGEKSPEVNTVYFGDSNTILNHFPDGFFDAVITDPPWLRYRGKKELEQDEDTHKVFMQVLRVMRLDTMLYAFVGHDDWFFYRDWLTKLGFKVSKTALIWQKEGSLSDIGVASWEYGRNYELILVAAKGQPALKHRTQKGSILTHKVVHPRRMIHPHEKPISLIRELLNDCSFPGATILDPFGGSGATAAACVVSDRRFVTIERNREFYENIEKRLDNKIVDELAQQEEASE